MRMYGNRREMAQDRMRWSDRRIAFIQQWNSVSQGASLRDFLLAPVCPIEKVTLWECDQPGKNPLKYSAAAGNRTRATGRTDSELSH